MTATNGSGAPDILRKALAYHDAGLSVLPVARDGSKRPDPSRLPRVPGDDGRFRATWGPLKAERPAREDVARMFAGSRPPGIGVIGGAVSGGLECIDFDSEAENLFPAWCGLVEAECPGLVGRLSVARTPKPGFHVRYRCPEVEIPGNTKLATDPAAPPDRCCLVETRGSGGYAVAPGSPADCHETGRLYEHYSGPLLENVQAVTAGEREVLIRCARSFDRNPQEEPAGTAGVGGQVLSPGDEYNRRGPDFLEIMEPHGWTLARKVPGARYVRRPGKNVGWSGTLDVCSSDKSGPLFACFSENAHPFQGASGNKPCTCYSRFAVYTLLNHGGDFSAAAKALGADGYGERRERSNGGRNGPAATAAEPPPVATPAWPDPPAAEAYYGLPGDIVRAVEPRSEADPVALLLQVLVGAGNILGRTAHFRAEDSAHFLNEYTVLVGATSKGRKGSSWGRVRPVLAGADLDWAKDHIHGGLSSGEGLIWAVRDPIVTHQATREKGKVTGHQEVETDPGVADKRLLVYEPEFATVLRQVERQGNILSATLRMAWETGELRTLVKNSPARATGAHISCIGHCTAEELRRYLSATEVANGLGNRFLWAAVRRSKVLPEGGTPDQELLDGLGRRLGKALQFGRRLRELRRDQRARAVWSDVYPELSEGLPGLAGALLARGEAHVMRLACVYAVLDRAGEVRSEHLLAALALWDYCEASVRFIFGDSLGDPVADEVLRMLRSARGDGLSRTKISEFLGRNQPAGRISQALSLLLQHKLARRAEEKREEAGKGKPGRPEERWYATRW
jgi:hypothetical protein